MSKEIFKEGKVFIQSDVENKQLKEESEKLRNEENEKLRKEESEKLKKEENEKLRKENEQLRKENAQLRKKNIVKDANIKELIEKPIEIKSPEEDKNTADSFPNWFDKNKFQKFIDSNKLNYRHKIGEFKYIDIKDMVNNIKNNKISKKSPKKGLNTLNELKNSEITKQKNVPLNRQNN